MVNLRNVIKTGNIIKYDYLSEGSIEDAGTVVFDLDIDDAIQVVLCPSDKETNCHYSYSKSIIALKRMLKENNGEVVDSYDMMWY